MSAGTEHDGWSCDIRGSTESTNSKKFLNPNNTMKEKMNKHEKGESKKFERKEKMTKSEPEYKGKGKGKTNYKGKMC